MNLSVQEQTVHGETFSYPIFRGAVTTSQGEVKDQTPWFDAYARASSEGEKLLTLYEEQSREKTVVVGFVSHETLEQFKDPAGWTVSNIHKDPHGPHVIPVTVKLNTHFATRDVRE